MLCGNDPAARGRVTPGDLAAVKWFGEWLCWSALPADEQARTPEPQPPSAGPAAGQDTTETEQR